MSPEMTVNRRHVVAETIDDETILIHLGTGIYYSLDGVGSAIWMLAEQGLQSPEIVERLSAAYPEEAGLEDALTTLMTQLMLEDLLIEGAPEDLAEPAPAPSLPPLFAAPSLQKYTDMQEFMLVDPLHEVDEAAGWPNVKTG